MEHTTSKDGTLIGFRRSGSGAPLLLVHGTTADHSRWAAISPAFERRFSVYAMDRRGRGASGDAADYHLLREAEDIAAVVEAIGGPVHVLGHSYGALCSLEAGLLTGKIGRLILYEPPSPAGTPLYPPGSPERIRELIDQGEPEAALELMMREVVRIPESELEVYRSLPMWKRRIAIAPTIPREMAIEMSYSFDAERIAALETPTLLLLGGASPALFSDTIRALDAMLPNSRVVILPGQGHVAMDTAPELFVDTVLGFLLE